MVVKQIGEWTEITRTYARLEQPLGEGWIVCQHTCAWQPPTDVYEDDDGVVVRIEVAGMSGEDLSVSLTGTRGGMGCTL
ncbi:MAG: hypothetical protein SXV54_22035, partial [Chloroflexota bacterium]|nr:hypothetical protein [Chloroflexota bacterium]